MAVSIYFTETRDFKLIKDKILLTPDEFLVYVYADTSNSKIPRELIKDLPIFGNNIIWVDSSKMDNSQLVNHVVLTIGQFLNAEDPISFFIASKTAKYEKAIGLLTDEGIDVEQIGSVAPSEVKKPGKRRGRPKSVKKEEAVPDVPKKKRGRPPKAKVEEAVDQAPKRRGRPPKEKPAESVDKPAKKKGRPAKKKADKPAKTRKPRVEKDITPEMVTESLTRFPTKDGDVELMQKKIFALRKVQRPKFDEKLSEMIQQELAIGDSEAVSLIRKMKETGMMDNSGKGNRLIYKD